MLIIEPRLHDRKEMWVLNISRKYSSMMPAPDSADVRWQVIWFAHIIQQQRIYFSQASVKEQWNAKFLVNGHVKPVPVSRSYSSISFTLREELVVFAHQIWKPQFLSFGQSPFDNCHQPLSPTTFFEISVCYFPAGEFFGRVYFES